MLFLVLKSAHVASVALFVGSILCTHLLNGVAEADRDAGGRQTYLRACVQLDRRLTAPGAGLVTATGLALLWLGGKAAFQQPWVWLAIVLWIASSGVGIFYLAPALVRAADGSGSGREWSRINGVVLAVQAVILLLMVIRPTL